MIKETTEVAIRYIALIDKLRQFADFIMANTTETEVDKILPNGTVESGDFALLREAITNVCATPGGGYTSTFYLGYAQLPYKIKNELEALLADVNDTKYKMASLYSAYLKAGGQTALVNDEYVRIASEANSSRWNTGQRLSLKPPFIKHATRSIKWVVDPDVIGFYARKLRRVEKVTDKRLAASLSYLSDEARSIVEKKIASVRNMSALRYVYDGEGVAYKSRIKTNNGWLNQSASLPMLVVSDYPFEYKSIHSNASSRNVRSDAGKYREIAPEIRIYEQI